MSKILNITNGDSAVEIMRSAKLPGEFLPWRDVLHDGPVPLTDSLESLSEVRAEYIASLGWGEIEQVKADFENRDRTLMSFPDYDKVLLWFEHDLYDQLQLIQILDWLAKQNHHGTGIILICTENYLGMQSPETIGGLRRFEQTVSPEQFHLASKAWYAFRSETPISWNDLLFEDTSALPFLEGAILRQLEEFPNIQSGLTRTEYQILKAVESGVNKPGKVFGLCQQMEERMYMGDSSFWLIMNGLCKGDKPLLETLSGQSISFENAREEQLKITEVCKHILTSEHREFGNPAPNKWIGGVHLSNENVWYWNPDERRVFNRDR